MKFTLDESGGGNVIQSYAEGQVNVNGIIYYHNLIVTPRQVIENWKAEDFTQLDAADFTLLAELKPEIVLLGTGAVHRFPHPSLSQPLIEQHIGLETMHTAAACRTYNILMGEGRNIAAALFMI